MKCLVCPRCPVPVKRPLASRVRLGFECPSLPSWRRGGGRGVLGQIPGPPLSPFHLRSMTAEVYLGGLWKLLNGRMSWHLVGARLGYLLAQIWIFVYHRLTMGSWTSQHSEPQCPHLHNGIVMFTTKDCWENHLDWKFLKCVPWTSSFTTTWERRMFSA